MRQRVIRRIEDDPNAVISRLRKPDARLGAGPAEEFVGDLEQDAGPVPGVGLASAGPAMVEVAEDRQRVADDGMGLLATHVDQEADAARVMLESRVVESLLGRRAGQAGRFGLHAFGSVKSRSLREFCFAPWRTASFIFETRWGTTIIMVRAHLFFQGG